jgi:hypothetical protein
MKTKPSTKNPTPKEPKGVSKTIFPKENNKTPEDKPRNKKVYKLPRATFYESDDHLLQ